jgi:multiple antibiotic resistance protein
MNTLQELVVQTLYLTALINPVSKISVLAVLSSKEERRALSAIVAKSSMVSAGILFGAMVFGDFLLRSVFQVQLHSLRAAGGVVLFWVGFNALRKGVFFEQETHEMFTDMAIVPLACPMIAGPATIAAAITLRARYGVAVPTCAMLLAVAVNSVLMLFARPIGAALSRFNILGALIRITGLVVMTIGTQMVLDGLREWQNLGSP